MDKAGQALAKLGAALQPHAKNIEILAGPGNNGGDGLVAARLWHQSGRRVSVSAVGDLTRLPADAARALAKAQAAGVPIRHGLPSANDGAALVVDALLGIGINRAPEEPIAQAIQWINSQSACVLSVDVPSGLNADNGNAWGGATVRANHCLSLLTLKPGFFTAQGRDYCGQLWLHGLDVVPDVQADAQLIGNQISDLPSRQHSQHKGSFGDLWVIGGTTGMQGAAMLAASAGLASGDGRVYLGLLDDNAAGAAAMPPELMRLARILWNDARALQQTTVLCGCGGGQAIRVHLFAALAHARRLVLDADALNVIAADTNLQQQLKHRKTRSLATIVTPHPLEAARLLKLSTAQIQADRLGAAQTLSRQFGVVAVLKGSGTVVCDVSLNTRINPTGSAALASPGTGDVLAGWMSGIWSQLNEHADSASLAARAAVYAHGLAGQHVSAGPILASELIERLKSLKRESA